MPRLPFRISSALLNAAFAVLLLLFPVAGAFAQTDSTAGSKDSAEQATVAAYNRLLQQIEAQNRADSQTKAELAAQLAVLRRGEYGQRDSLRISKRLAEIDSLKKITHGYPVKGFFDDTLFLMYTKQGSFSAKDRAMAISSRISDIKGKFRLTKDSLKVVASEAMADILWGETIIMSISEDDALWNGTTVPALAEKYKSILSNELVKYKSETSIITLAKEIGLALALIILIRILIFYIGKLFKWTAIKIRKQKDNLIRGIKIRDYVLFDAEHEVRVLLNVNTGVEWLVILLVLYAALPLLFGIFPWTQNLAETLFGYILSPLRKMAVSFVHFLPNMVTIIVIVVVFRYVLKGIRFLKCEIEKEDLKIPGFYPDWANPTYQIVRILVLAFMVVIIFPYLPGSDSPIFRGISVFLGFLFTFGSAGSLSNIIAGLILTYMRLFKIGDRVKIGEVTGDIIEKSLLVTRIRTIKNEIISIPNSTVMSSHTINYSSDTVDKGLIVHTTVTIGYDVPWKDVHQALIDAALRTDLVLKEPLPFVLQTSLEDFYVAYQVNAYVREANKQAAIYSALHQHIQDVFNERGIEILSPHYRAARDGNMTTIPANYLPEDYKAPSFNVNTGKTPDKD